MPPAIFSCLPLYQTKLFGKFGIYVNIRLQCNWEFQSNITFLKHQPRVYGTGDVWLKVCESRVCITFPLSLQDAHNCIPELDDETAMFAVYDGHGGMIFSAL